MDKAYCKRCGNELLPGSSFCMRCGTKISGIEAGVNHETGNIQKNMNVDNPINRDYQGNDNSGNTANWDYRENDNKAYEDGQKPEENGNFINSGYQVNTGNGMQNGSHSNYDYDENYNYRDAGTAVVHREVDDGVSGEEKKNASGNWFVSWFLGLDIFCKISAVLITLFTLAGIISAFTDHTVVIVMSFIQVTTVVIAWLFHKKIIKLNPKHDFIKYLLLLFTILLMMINIKACSSGKDDEEDDRDNNKRSEQSGKLPEDENDQADNSSGDLNSKIKVTWHDGDYPFTEYYKFEKSKDSSKLINIDSSGMEWKYTTMNLDDALKIRETKKIKDY